MHVCYNATETPPVNQISCANEMSGCQIKILKVSRPFRLGRKTKNNLFTPIFSFTNPTFVLQPDRALSFINTKLQTQLSKSSVFMLNKLKIVTAFGDFEVTCFWWRYLLLCNIFVGGSLCRKSRGTYWVFLSV